MDRFKKELAVAGLILVIAVGLLVISGDYEATYTSSSDALGPLFWPRVVLGIIIATSFVNIGKIVHKWKYATEGDPDEAPSPAGGESSVADTDGGVVTGDVSDGESETVPAQERLDEVEEEIASPDDQQNTHHFVGTILLTVAYIGLLDLVGFLVLTPVFLTAVFWMLGYRHALKAPLVAVVTTVVLIAVFQKVMLVPLPRGEGVFRELSYALVG